MIKQLYQTILRILFVAGLLLVLVALLETIRFALLLHQFSPTLAYVVGGLLVAAVIGGCIYVGVKLRSYPRVLRPPPLPARGEEAGFHDLVRYVKYLARYLDRLAANPNLSEEERSATTARAAVLREILRAHPLRDDLTRAITTTEEEGILPLLGKLRETAERQVRDCVRDVMIGVTLIPYHSIDLAVVLYRNFGMIFRIVHVFASRPAPREQMLILRDTARVVVTVNFLHIGRNLIEGLFSQVPVLGRFVDDIGQGIGAGLFTSAAGHAAIDRCASFKGWDRAEAAENLASHARGFLTDVRDIFTKDVLPGLKPRIRAAVPEEQAEAAGFWTSISNGIGAAVDTTAGAVQWVVVKPAVAGTRMTRDAVVATGRTGKSAYLGVGRGLRNLGKPFRRRDRDDSGN